MSAEPDAGWSAAVETLDRRLADVFAALERWLVEPAERLDLRPAPDAWTAREVCEHVTLANRYLLLLAEKIERRSSARAARGAPVPERPSRTDHLEALAQRDFRWRHPEHMAPEGAASLAELRARLHEQAGRCKTLLERAPRGEGALHAIRMSAVGDGAEKLDLYQFLALIALHAERHVRQMERSAAAGRGSR